MKFLDKKTGIQYLFIAEHPHHPVVILETPQNTFISMSFGEFDRLVVINE